MNCGGMVLAVGPPRLAPSTTTTMSTGINGIYMLPLPKQQLHQTEAPTIFEGSNKSDSTAGSSTSFKIGHLNYISTCH
eukprot:5408168-Amphidinium_carterae.1